jgi:hypothetical protein
MIKRADRLPDIVGVLSLRSYVSLHSRLFSLFPKELELQFILDPFAFMLDVKNGFGGDVQAFARNLYGEGPSPFQGVGQAAELGHKPAAGVGPFQISSTSRHGFNSFKKKVYSR